MTRRVRTAVEPSLIAIAEPSAVGTGEGRISFWRLGGERPRLDRLSTVTPSALTNAIEESAAGRVVVLLPAGQARCRVCELPNAGDAQLAVALSLQAESVHLGTMPAHRTASAVFPRRAGSARSGVIIDWPPSEPLPSLPGAILTARRTTFAADVSALVGLASVTDVRGPLLVIDAARGMVSFALVTPKGLALRSARESVQSSDAHAAHDNQDRHDTIVRLVLETAIHHGVPDADLERLASEVREAATSAAGSGFGCTAKDRALLASALGIESDADWWRANALHAGIVLAAAGPLASITSLRAHDPGEEPGFLGGFVNRLADPRVLGPVAVAAVIAIIFGPLLIAALEWGIMRWKVNAVGVDRYRSAVEQNDQTLAIYRGRTALTWPMTKLLADLACCTPEGVEFEQVNIVQGESISVRGLARRNDQLSAPEVVLRMEKLMNDSRLFSKINKSWEAPNQMGMLQFTLSANVTAPTMPMIPAEGQDWAKVTLAERKYGPAARPPDRAAATGPAPANGAVAPPAEAPGPESGEATAGAETPVTTSAAVAAASAEGTTTTPAADPAADTPAGATGDGAPGAAGSTAPAQPADTATASTAGGRDITPTGSRTIDPSRRGLQMTGQTGARGERAGPAASDLDVPPPPLSQTVIDAMSKEEALAAASNVAKARNNKAFDDPTRERLKEEFYKLMAQVRAKS